MYVCSHRPTDPMVGRGLLQPMINHGDQNWSRAHYPTHPPTTKRTKPGARIETDLALALDPDVPRPLHEAGEVAALGLYCCVCVCVYMDGDGDVWGEQDDDGRIMVRTANRPTNNQAPSPHPQEPPTITPKQLGPTNTLRRTRIAPPTRKLRGSEAKRALALAPPFLPAFLPPAAAFFGACGDGDVCVVWVCVCESVAVGRSMGRSVGRCPSTGTQAVAQSCSHHRVADGLTDGRRPSIHPHTAAHVPWLRVEPSRENLWEARRGGWMGTRGSIN